MDCRIRISIMTKLYHEQFTQTALRQPANTALTDVAGSLTYREADEITNGLALSLVEAGLAPGEAAAVFVSRQKEIVVGALAVMKAGGVYLPLDEGYPDERLAYMLDDAKVRFVLVDRTLYESRSESFAGRTVFFFDEARALAEYSPVKRTPEDPAMILYTSGTTGKPKGVIHRHALLMGVNDWLDSNPGLTLNPESRMGIMSGYTFIATNVFMLGVLFGGGTLFIAPAEVRLSTDVLYQYIKENGITHIFMPSSLTAAMSEDYDMSGVAILSGGEKLRNFTPLSPETRVYNMYGSTELATIFTIRVSGNEPVMPIGHLTKGAEALLVDEELHPVKEGESGELLLHDERMSQEYLGLPELTKEKWIRIGGQTYFRTGDRMRRDENGCYYILGRIDNMVKLRGFRVETGEVETQAAKGFLELGFPAGQVVVVLRNINGIDHLVCYYESEQSVDPRKITEVIADFLPAYMVPDLWCSVAKMPRNANGKVIRAELPEPELPIHLLGYIDSEAELRVAEAAGYVLKLDGAIDPDDSFVQLGGDSLRAMELSSVLSEQGIQVSGADILSQESLRGIAGAARIRYERFWSADEYEAVRRAYLEHGETIERILPLTPAQDDMLCRQLTHPDRPVSENRFLFVYESRLSEDVLRSVLDEIAARHEELRASIVCRDVSVFQCAITDRKIPLKMIKSCGEDLSSVQKILNEDTVMAGYDLQFSPMLKVVCVDREQEPSWLFVMVNRIVYDEDAFRRLFAEMTELLLASYPEDRELQSWSELLHEAIAERGESGGSGAAGGSKAEARESDSYATIANNPAQDAVRIYSDKPARKIFFVHTGNTGSAAYYQLAQRIRKDYAFGVIEPYNLYHMEDAVYGIRNIAARYIEIMKQYQPVGPYILGGWCYGGVVAHEMACQLEAAGEKVEHLILLDSHALASDEMRKLAAPMQASVKRSYFETSPLFKDLRENGMLEAVVSNAAHVAQDLNAHVPGMYHGAVTYFKPDRRPAAATGEVLQYWSEMMNRQAGNYENYCEEDQLEVVSTPGEHDDMMLPEALDVIVPKLYEVLGSHPL